jgi:hypothetical protein
MTSTRHANIFERLIIELSEQIHLDVVGLKGVGILSEADCRQPGSDLIHSVPQQCIGRTGQIKGAGLLGVHISFLRHPQWTRPQRCL